MNSYKVELAINNDTLSCEMTREELCFIALITQKDLKSDYLRLEQLKSIIESNSVNTLPGYNIEVFEESFEENTPTLTLKIAYTNEFIEFEETIEFREKGSQAPSNPILNLALNLQTSMLDLEEIQSTNLNLVLDLQTRLDKQEIKIKELEKKLNEDKLLFFSNSSSSSSPSPSLAETKTFFNQMFDWGPGSNPTHGPNPTNILLPASVALARIFYSGESNKIEFDFSPIVSSQSLTLTMNINETMGVNGVGSYNFWNATYTNDNGLVRLRNSDILRFDIKRLRIDSYLEKYNNPQPASGVITEFLNNYLTGRKNFVIDEIIINDNIYFYVLLKHSNYKKITVIQRYMSTNVYNHAIQTHCKINGIELNYIR